LNKAYHIPKEKTHIEIKLFLCKKKKNKPGYEKFLDLL